MHPRNRIRLTAGIPIDPELEKVSKEELNENVDEVGARPSPSEQTSTTSDNYQDGDITIYNNGIYVVVLSDPKTDMVGIIPAGMVNASAAEKNRAVEMVKPDPQKFRKPSQEEIDVFQKSDEELAAVDDDMDIEFSAESAVNEWDMGAVEKGSRKYKADQLRKMRQLDKEIKAKKARKAAALRGDEDEEMNYYADDEDLSDVDPNDVGAEINHMSPETYHDVDDDADYDTGQSMARADSMGEPPGTFNNELTDADLRQLGMTRADVEKVLRFYDRGYTPDSDTKSIKAFAGLPETPDDFAADKQRAARHPKSPAGRGLGESTQNYKGTPSHGDTQSQPINTVAQGEKQWANSLDPATVKNEYTQQVDNRGKESMTEEADKVKVPSRIKEALRDAIKAFRTDAEKQGNTATARENAQFYMDTADAFEQILEHLEGSTVMDIKHAQVFAQTLMGPMLHKLPDGVWDFISNGGQKKSLKDYMNKVS